MSYRPRVGLNQQQREADDSDRVTLGGGEEPTVALT